MFILKVIQDEECEKNICIFASKVEAEKVLKDIEKYRKEYIKFITEKLIQFNKELNIKYPKLPDIKIPTGGALEDPNWYPAFLKAEEIHRIKNGEISIKQMVERESFIQKEFMLETELPSQVTASECIISDISYFGGRVHSYYEYYIEEVSLI